jgi:DNA-binding PadR family transcriptional regulator
MARIIFDLEAIEDIKNKLGSLIQSGQKLESSELKKLIRQKTEVLDEYEKIVFDYIRNNPGTSKQRMVVSLKRPSRGTIYKVLDRLKKYNMVISRSDDRNIQKHQLFVNNESLIIQVEKDIKAFKRSYLNLIKRANEKYRKKLNQNEDELKKSRRPQIDIPEIYSSGVANDLSNIFKQLILTYSLNAIFKWPEQIKDSESLNRLYLMLFQSLNEIFSELVKHAPFDIEDKHERLEYLQEGLRYSFEDAKMYADMISEFDEYNLGTEFDLVMSDLFTASKMRMTWKNYRTGLNM